MLSVIMSIYNETMIEISKSVASILNQRYRNFEVIIVIDNPERHDAENFLSEIEKSDSRVRHFVNNANIGLAMSMNKAASEASGNYLVRMDADDICELRRFEVQLRSIEETGADVICSDYCFIDENDKVLQISHFVPSDEDIVKNLPYNNAIHHPTVMMRKELFDVVGGYRDFPCAQDYDLWLRLLENGAKFHIVPEKLLRYRVRTNSISQSIRVKQYETLLYIRKLYNERQRKGTDSFSKENYECYLRKHNVYNASYCNEVISNRDLKNKIDGFKGKSRIKRGLYMIVLCVKCRFYRKYYYNSLKNKFLLMTSGK